MAEYAVNGDGETCYLFFDDDHYDPREYENDHYYEEPETDPFFSRIFDVETFDRSLRAYQPSMHICKTYLKILKESLEKEGIPSKIIENEIIRGLGALYCVFAVDSYLDSEQKESIFGKILTTMENKIRKTTKNNRHLLIP